MKKLKKLHVKLTVLYTCFAVLLGVFISLFGYRITWNQATSFYSEKAEQAAALACTYVDGDRIGQYLHTMQTDAYYDELKAIFSTIKRETGLAYLYAFDAGADKLTYIVEGQLETDDPALISSLGETYDYTDFEFSHLVPDVEAGRASEDVHLSTEALGYGHAVSAWVPVFDSAGEVMAMIEADIGLDQVEASIRRSIVLMLVVYLALIAVMILLQAVSVRRMITRPLRKLTDHTLQFAAKGELSAFADDIKTGDELQTLSEAFGQMARDITAYTQEKAGLAAEQERIATELEVASEIQQSMLPDELPDFPGKKFLDLQGRLVASRNMGGNFYDYFLLDDHRVGVVICGMQDTGIPAAMLLVVTRTIIKSQFLGDRPLEQTMGEINRQVFDAIDKKRPISAFVGMLDTDDGQFTYVNAGYNPPVVMSRGERYEFLTSPAYTPLGAERNVTYRELKLKLKQGDCLLFYSDGVIQARSSDGGEYGNERLRARLNESRGGEARSGKVMESVLSAVEEFTGKKDPASDLVLLALEYKRGDRELAQLVLPPDMDRVPALQEFLKDQMAMNKIAGKDYARVLVCAEELFSICCKYTVGDRVEIDCAVPDSARLVLRFTADLRGADPLGEEASAVVKNAVAFIRNNAESLELVRVEGRSALVMTKALA